MSIQVAVQGILQRAVELDKKNRLTESLICYQEGIQMLVDLLRELTGERRLYFRSKIEEYIKRAETIKALIEKHKKNGSFHEQIKVDNDSIGHSYLSVFGRFLDGDVETVKIEEPYVRNYYQCQNLVRFCELLVKKCNKLKKVEILTVRCGREQEGWFKEIKCALEQHNVCLNILYSETLHDRQILLSTGWIIKIGRGLDYFKAAKGKLSIGAFDLDLRPCHETVIDIFHSSTVVDRS